MTRKTLLQEYDEAVGPMEKIIAMNQGTLTERIQRLAELSARENPTPEDFDKMRERAWTLTRQAHAALTAYACLSEDHEQPRMSDDAIDAGDLAATIGRYDHRFEDAQTGDTR